MKKKFNYANAVQEILDKIEVSYMSQKKDAGTIFNIPMPGQNMSNLTVNLHVHNNGNVKISVYPVRKVKQQFRTDILEVLNGLNGKYRITRFMIDADGDICVDYDMILTDEDSNIIGSQILMTLLMFSDIVDETFLEILLTSRYGKKINQKVTALLSNVEQAVSDKDDSDEDDFDGDDPDEDDFDGDDPDEDDFDGDETLESLLPEMDAEFLQKLISISEKCFDEDDE